MQIFSRDLREVIKFLVVLSQDIDTEPYKSSSKLQKATQTKFNKLTDWCVCLQHILVPTRGATDSLVGNCVTNTTQIRRPAISSLDSCLSLPAIYNYWRRNDSEKCLVPWRWRNAKMGGTTVTAHLRLSGVPVILYIVCVHPLTAQRYDGRKACNSVLCAYAFICTRYCSFGVFAALSSLIHMFRVRIRR